MTAPRGHAGALVLIGGGLTACGGGLPLLHPVAPLARGEVRAATGVAGQFALGDLGRSVRAASLALDPADAAAENARTALVLASVGPGVAPFVAARVGLGDAFEGGLAYTGRAARVDLRRAFAVAPHWDVSVEAAGSAAITSEQSGAGVPGLDLASLHGWGADAPVVVGYGSDGRLVSAWVGARAGWERAELGAEGQSASLEGGAAALTVTRLWAGALVGLAMGFRHVHVAMELDASYVDLVGDFTRTHAHVVGATVSPAGALLWTF